jgi:VanZ family protein
VTRGPFVRFWAPVVAYLALTLVASSIPPKELKPLALGGWDKLAHAIEYAGLSAVVARALRGAGPWSGAPSRRAVALAALAASVAWGAIDETYQRVTGRQPDPFDLLADGAGALLAQAASLAAPGRMGAARRVVTKGNE